jgi:hypothetical protein
MPYSERKEALVSAEKRPEKLQTTEASDRPPSQAFTFPSPEEWSGLVRDLKLEPGQEHELRLTLHHVDEDLKNFRMRFDDKQPRKELVRRLKRVAKALSALDDEIQRWHKTMTDFLPFDTLETIGLTMSYSAMEAALNEQIPSRDVKGVVERLRVGDAAVRIAEIEERFDYQRKAIGLKRGPELLAHLIESINRPIKSWLELDRCNHGGRPSNVTRDYLLFRLAESAREILGDKPTTTANGPFHRMCGYVFPACGLDAEGLEKAIERTLKKHKSMFWKKQVKNTDGEP